MTTFDPQQLRSVLGHYPTGVTIVTGIAPDGEALALVVGTFTSVSLDPPLVSFLPMKESSTFARLSECDALCINVLTADQEGLCRTIASRRSDKLAEVGWSPAPSGAPVLDGCLAWLDVRLEQSIEAGDHWIALCRVLDLAVVNPVAPLLFFQGGYGSFVVPSLIARIDADIEAGVHEAVASRSELESLADEIGGHCTLLKVVNRDELTAVAMAAGRTGTPNAGLGRRLPIIPPIADAWVAMLGEEEQAYWLSKAAGADEARLETYRRRLEFCREHGYLLSFARPDEEVAFESLHEATTTYAERRPTPAEIREIRQRITAATPPESYGMRPLEEGGRYDISSIIVPIGDARGAGSLMLRVTGLPREADAGQVRIWIARVRATAAEIEAGLAR
ncbi:flavin reductase family protein [Granulicoccus sp. GXG6511]|uniref:flavin reductase family protein n=1 Tax=Granulicoccus sp. GXG6511 TaxID=3381351 RepID=UPI003D7C8C33